jgi:hypothetical protein
MEATTIWEAARGRLAQWTPVVRSKEGSRSLPGSPRFTDNDIRSAPNVFGATDKSQCGSATGQRQHAQAGKTFPDSSLLAASLATWIGREPTPTSLAYVSLRGSPDQKGGSKNTTREESEERRRRAPERKD